MIEESGVKYSVPSLLTHNQPPMNFMPSKNSSTRSSRVSTILQDTTFKHQHSEQDKLSGRREVLAMAATGSPPLRRESDTHVALTSISLTPPSALDGNIRKIV